MWQEKIIREYFAAWLEKKADVLESIFAENIVYSECYGPEYHGLWQIKQWFSDWNQRGSVWEWSIKRFLHQDNVTVVEWFFRCEYDGNTDGFDGVSIITFNEDRKILELKEFSSKAEHNFPYGQ